MVDKAADREHPTEHLDDLNVPGTQANSPTVSRNIGGILVTPSSTGSSSISHSTGNLGLPRREMAVKLRQHAMDLMRDLKRRDEFIIALRRIVDLVSL